ncbi:MAG: RES family NAD+ phosphorylase [Chitinophagales bacterium]
MFFYRVAHKKFLHDLSGEGARLYGGRWNSPGVSMVYTSLTLELAMFESIAHNTFTSLIKHFGIIILEVNAKVSAEELLDSSLPKNWNSYPPPPSLARIGDRWISSKSSLLLKVPSSLFSSSGNSLINPNHPEFKMIKVVEVKDIAIDVRLMENLRK